MATKFLYQSGGYNKCWVDIENDWIAISKHSLGQYGAQYHNRVHLTEDEQRQLYLILKEKFDEKVVAVLDTK